MEAMKKLKSGMRFRGVATQYSEYNPEDLGWMTRGAVREAAFALAISGMVSLMLYFKFMEMQASAGGL
jgi:hypothetical protein